MRAGPLSDEKVIGLLNRYFVPVYTVNEDYRPSGAAPAEEKAELRRVYLAALAAHLSTGTVHVYILDTRGEPVDSLHVANAARTERLLALLSAMVERFQVKGAAPLVAPAPQSVAPAAPAGSLVLHLTSRALEEGSWHEFPAENWIVLGPEEAAKLLPPRKPASGRSGDGPPAGAGGGGAAAGAASGAEWEVDPQVAEKILGHFYPQTENNDLSTNRFLDRSLLAKVVGEEGGKVRARLQGSFRMAHSFYPKKPDGKVVEASLVGLLEFEPESRKVLSLRLVTDKARYGKVAFGAGLLTASPGSP